VSKSRSFSTNTSSTLSPLSRRDFLHMGTASAAAILTTSAPFRYLETAFNHAVDASLSGTIAVLIPHHGIGATANDAFTRVFAEQYPNVQLLTSEVRPYWSDVVRAAQTLIDRQQAKIIVTLMNPTLSPEAHALFASADTLLIVASAGENIVRREERLPNILHHSLHLWEANHAFGQWAAQHYGKRGMIISDLYDSGFDALHAFQMGVEAAGGEIISTYVQPNHNGSSVDTASLKALVSANRPDYLFQMSSHQPHLEAAFQLLAQEMNVRLLSSPLDNLTAHYSRLGIETAALAATSLSVVEAASGDVPAACIALHRQSSQTAAHRMLNASLPEVDCDCAIDAISTASVKTGWSTPYLMM
jgi:hypothetical protein